MERLQNWFYKNILKVSTQFKRYLWQEINWESRFIIVIGARGVGKTTMLLQYIKENLPINEKTIYASLDDIYFSNHSIIDFVEEFVKNGGENLILDEVQKYVNWSRELKNIYDNFLDLKIILSGSSTIEILKSEGDLSRRALYYHMQGMSFREYLNFTENTSFERYTLEDITAKNITISMHISNTVKPIKSFKNYLKAGYYPFFKEDYDTYQKRISQIINTVIEVDIPNAYTIEYQTTRTIKKLLSEIAEMVPFKPNIKKLSEKIGISREALGKYLKLLDHADIINLLYSQTKGISLLGKPEKIYLNNPNIAYALNTHVNVGSLREGFFTSQLLPTHKLRYSGIGDFIVDDTYIFEIGGKSKQNKQIAGVENSWIIADNLEVAVGNKIPLWLMGFNY